MAHGFHTNLLNVAKHYVHHLNIPITNKTLRDNLEENPYYPTLYSLSNVFDRFNIPNEAFNVDEGSLDSVKPPFITYCSGQTTGKDFVLVTKITDTHVSYIAENNKLKIIGKENFKSQWKKIVFIGTPDSKSGESDYSAKFKSDLVRRRKQNLLYTCLGILAGMMIYLSLINTSANLIIPITSIILIKLLGLTVTILLLIYEIDKNNSFVKNICTARKKTNCNAVLNSKVNNFLGMSWGEIGFFYFSSTTLFLLFSDFPFINKIIWLSSATTLAVPYILFSVFYQWKVVKQWCPLCLIVQLVLAIEFIWTLFNFWLPKTYLSFNIDSQSIISFFCYLLLPFILWYLIKPLLNTAKLSQGFKFAYKRVLYHPKVFSNLLGEQPKIPDGWEQLGIDIGDPNAATTIIKVCHPYCRPCAKAHPTLGEIVKNNKSVRLKVIFMPSYEENDSANSPAKHLLAVAAYQDVKLTEQALDDWYTTDKKNYEIFAAKYPLNNKLDDQNGKIELMRKWCIAAEITGTPTIFINGRHLPGIYSIEELKNIF